MRDTGTDGKSRCDIPAAGNPTISVVIPVYNVGAYLEECMESLVAQTFADFEALLIDDGSTDDSPARCDAWAERDPRIEVIHIPNGGVAKARNLGIERARGTYLAFVDPDDWLEPRYLELLVNEAERTGASFVECDLWRYDNRTGKSIWRHCAERTGVPYDLREHMKYGPTATYKSLTRRSLWIDNDVRLPSCSFESPAVYALVLALAAREGGLAYVPKPLYHYRRFRENSLIETGYASHDGTPDNALGVAAMEHLLAEFDRTGLADEYADDLRGIVTYRLSDILAMQYHRKPASDFAEVVRNFRGMLARHYPEVADLTYLTLGGYNLNRILTHMEVLNDPSARFNFSSIIALAGKGPDERGGSVTHATHPNRYREMMVNRELSGKFWEMLGAEQPTFLFLDLIEERSDIGMCATGPVTLSDAFMGASCDLGGIEVIGRHTTRCAELWQASVRVFVERLARTSPGTRLVVVESYLAERVGDLDHQEEFPGLDEIRIVNELLEKYYHDLHALCPGAVFVDTRSCGCHLTDRGYEYGAIPSHLNEVANQRIAASIQDAIGLPTPHQGKGMT